MKTFLAIYRGDTFGNSRIVAVSIDPDVVAFVAGHLIEKMSEVEYDQIPHDPVRVATEQGRRQALAMIRQECENR
jgi:hypothetical protein